MTLFWDKNCPKTIPEALQKLNLPIGIEFYLEHFPLSDSQPEGGDDKWMEEIAAWGWNTVISQDYSFHTRENERFAIKQYDFGCFYLWGHLSRNGRY